MLTKKALKSLLFQITNDLRALSLQLSTFILRNQLRGFHELHLP
jgi:hypothetical protein